MYNQHIILDFEMNPVDKEKKKNTDLTREISKRFITKCLISY